MMTSLETLTGLPPALLIMPAEPFDKIIGYLDVPDLQTLRLCCSRFFAIIAPPTHADLVTIERSLQNRRGHFACVGCTKIRPPAMFSPSMLKKKKALGGSQAHNRFCNDCGKRPLPGLHRWMLGNRWGEELIGGSYMLFVRCSWCETIARAPADAGTKLCLGCYTYNIERRRAAEEVQRVQREMREREERRSSRDARRIQWIANNRAVSDFSSQDPRSEEEEDNLDACQWEEFAMNYSACS